MGYMGGKGNSFRRIIGAMPEHDTYIETHLGGGAVMRHKKPAPRQIGIDLDADVIAQWQAGRSQSCELVHGDAITFLEDFPFHGGELVYCDPPYLRATRSSRQSYRCDYTDYDHHRLLDTLTNLGCRVMLSGGDDARYAQRLSDWRRIEFRSGARRGSRIEILWMNFDAPNRLHDPRYRGLDFRDRERLKRQFTTITRKIESLPATERAVFARWFVERYPEEVRGDNEWI